jgi:hypothetical protein
MRSELAVVEGRAPLAPGEEMPLLPEFSDDRYGRRGEQITESEQWGAVYRARNGRQVSLLSITPLVANAVQCLEQRELQVFNRHAAIRHMMADRIEGAIVRTRAPERWLAGYPERLRFARRSGQLGMCLATGKAIVMWDLKAGLSRLCPDDAREEAMRLRRRVQATLEALQAAGSRLTYAVFTSPNVPLGRLRAEMVGIFTRFKRIVLDPEAFPQISGALAVLEAPLSRDREWNVHLNVILVTRPRQFLDWGKLRRLWHWQVHLKSLPTNPGAVGAALTELIKYAVAATSSKSFDKTREVNRVSNRQSREAPAPVIDATYRDGSFGDTRSAAEATHEGRHAAVAATDCGRSHPDRDARRSHGHDARQVRSASAPPMTEWEDPELLEWLRAMHGFRRTRAYGVLYGLETPEPEPLGQVVWLGSVSLVRGRYGVRCRLLDLIQEDKSRGGDRLTPLEALYRQLAPGGIPEALAIFDRCPDLRLVEHGTW